MNAPPRRNVQFLDIDALCDECEEAGMAWADAKAAADVLEETRKSVLAQAMTSYFAEGLAVNKSETHALADRPYVAFIENMVKARHTADRARVRYDILRQRIELLRTNASTERAAMSMR